MSKTAKILVTIGAIFICVLLITALSSGKSSGRPGVLGIVLTFGLVAGLRAIWKKPTEENDEDNHKLDKTS